MKLIIPTTEIIQEYSRKFNKDPSVPAIALLMEWKPNNKDVAAILLKAVVINQLYSTQILDIKRVAGGILKIADLDARLQRGDERVVDEIATAGEIRTRKGKIRKNYSFATKYCSWHQPNSYPIFDSLVSKLLRRYSRECGAPFIKREIDLHNYQIYRGAVNHFRNHICGLEHIGYQELDKFLYLYAKDIYPQAAKSASSN